MWRYLCTWYTVIRSQPVHHGQPTHKIAEQKAVYTKVKQNSKALPTACRIKYMDDNKTPRMHVPKKLFLHLCTRFLLCTTNVANTQQTLSCNNISGLVWTERPSDKSLEKRRFRIRREKYNICLPLRLKKFRSRELLQFVVAKAEPNGNQNPKPKSKTEKTTIPDTNVPTNHMQSFWSWPIKLTNYFWDTKATAKNTPSRNLKWSTSET